MFQSDVKERITAELTRGEQARKEGFEGRARVCARRAAGAAIGEYLRQVDAPQGMVSAYDLIFYFQTLPEISLELRSVAAHLTARVDDQFSLPDEIDLLAETRWLVDELENALG
jgi:hypothetical protein